MLEYVQIKTILTPRFEIVLNSNLKRSKLKRGNAHKSRSHRNIESMLGSFISENSSSTGCCAISRKRLR